MTTKTAVRSNLKVGDIVTGTDDYHYAITTDMAKMKVVGVYGSSITVRVIRHRLPQAALGLGAEYNVVPQWFRKVRKGEPFRKIKSGGK